MRSQLIHSIRMRSISSTTSRNFQESSRLRINNKRFKNKIIRHLDRQWFPMRFLIKMEYQCSTTLSISTRLLGNLNLRTVSSKPSSIRTSFNSSYSNNNNRKWAIIAIILLYIRSNRIILSSLRPNLKRAATIPLISRCLRTYSPWTPNPFRDTTTVCYNLSSATRMLARLKVHLKWVPLIGH